jgi:hypothetical protein
MHHLHINITHHGRDNVGVLIDGESIHFTDYMELPTDDLSQSFVAPASLNLEDTVTPFSQEMLRSVLDEWRESDKHNGKD